MSVFRSPRNSPYAQWDRLRQIRAQYHQANKTKGWGETVLGAAIWLTVIAIIFYFIDLPILAVLSLLAILIPPVVYAFWYAGHMWRYPHDHLTCPWCEHTVSIVAAWMCGHCRKQNWGEFNNPKLRAFAEACVHCGLVPYALSCPKCSKPIIFKEHEYKQCPEELAWIIDFPPKPIERQDTLEERRRKLKI